MKIVFSLLLLHRINKVEKKLEFSRRRGMECVFFLWPGIFFLKKSNPSENKYFFTFNPGNECQADSSMKDIDEYLCDRYNSKKIHGLLTNLNLYLLRAPNVDEKKLPYLNRAYFFINHNTKMLKLSVGVGCMGIAIELLSKILCIFNVPIDSDGSFACVMCLILSFMMLSYYARSYLHLVKEVKK